jgi:hypothetical protein
MPINARRSTYLDGLLGPLEIAPLRYPVNTRSEGPKAAGNSSELLKRLALPREAHDFNICNVLAGGLGKLSGIDLQDVSAAAPKLFAAVRRDALGGLIG